MYHNRPVFSNESEGILLFGSELNKEKITKNTEHKEWRGDSAVMLSQPTACYLVSRAWRLFYILESRFCIFRHIINAIFATYRQKICNTYQTLHLNSHDYIASLCTKLVSPVRHVEIN